MAIPLSRGQAFEGFSPHFPQVWAPSKQLNLLYTYVYSNSSDSGRRRRESLKFGCTMRHVSRGLGWRLGRVYPLALAFEAPRVRAFWRPNFTRIPGPWS